MPSAPIELELLFFSVALAAFSAFLEMQICVWFAKVQASKF